MKYLCTVPEIYDHSIWVLDQKRKKTLCETFIQRTKVKLNKLKHHRLTRIIVNNCAPSAPFKFMKISALLSSLSFNWSCKKRLTLTLRGAESVITVFPLILSVSTHPLKSALPLGHNIKQVPLLNNHLPLLPQFNNRDKMKTCFHYHFYFYLFQLQLQQNQSRLVHVVFK